MKNAFMCRTFCVQTCLWSCCAFACVAHRRSRCWQSLWRPKKNNRRNRRMPNLQPITALSKPSESLDLSRRPAFGWDAFLFLDLTTDQSPPSPPIFATLAGPLTPPLSTSEKLWHGCPRVTLGLPFLLVAHISLMGFFLLYKLVLLNF